MQNAFHILWYVLAVSLNEILEGVLQVLVKPNDVSSTLAKKRNFVNHMNFASQNRQVFNKWNTKMHYHNKAYFIFFVFW